MEDKKQTIINFQTLFEAAPGLFLILKPDTPYFTILGASDAYLQATMTKRNHITGRGLFEVFPDNPDDDTATGTSNLRKSLERVLKNKAADKMELQKYDIQRPQSEGGGFEERHWRPLNSPVLNKKNKVEYIIHRVEDVTEFVLLNKKAEEEIKITKAESDKKTLFIKTTQTRINTILDVLIKYTKLDFSEEIATSENKDDLDAIVVGLNALREEIENHIGLLKDSENKLLSANKELKEATEKLKTQNFLLTSTISSYKDILIFSIDTNYHYLVFNEAFSVATFQTYSTNINIGMNMLDSITNKNDRKKAKYNCDKALSGEAHVTLEVYGNLTHYYYETRYSPIFNDKGDVIGVTIMSANVTDRKRAEEQLLELNKELESFSYSVSHDLRAPLRAIDGYAGMLEEDYGKNIDEEGNRLLQAVQYNAKKMGNLIDDLLAFSRLGKKELTKTNLNMNDLVEAALYELNKSIKHNATVKINNLDAGKGDYGLINQVVINLLSNAIKYSAKVKSPLIEINSEKTETEIIYSVKDNGAGFDMRYVHKLFGVFQRLHTMDEFEGTGVGLAIVQRIMNKHGGKVSAEAEKDKGAIFKFSLPIN